MDKVIKSVLFVCLFVLGIVGLQSVFGVSNIYSEHAEMMMNGYYETEESTVDAVVIGNSHVYRYWQGAFGWRNNGIAVLGLSTSDMSGGVIKNVAIEAMKNQNPKLIIVEVSAFADPKIYEDSIPKVYLLLNNMKYSPNYYSLASNFCETSDIEGEDRFQYYLPIVQFHSRWDDLKERDFVQTDESYLNSCYQEDFMTTTIDYMEHTYTSECSYIYEGLEAALRDYLEWCGKQKDIEFLFFASPTLRDSNRASQINTVGKIVEEYGYTFVDFNDEEWYDGFGFVEDMDFQDINHTNLNGSYKFCKVFSQYLADNYGLEDHRGQAEYEEWQKKSDTYFDIVGEYLTDEY